MTDLPTKEILNRIFEAIEYLIATKEITGVSDFCKKHNVNQAKMYKQRSGYYEANISQANKVDFNVVYFLRKYYGISLEWIVLGEGDMKYSDNYVKV
ncbi:hypothetical protein [Soonwooa purpurea]